MTNNELQTDNTYELFLTNHHPILVARNKPNETAAKEAKDMYEYE